MAGLFDFNDPNTRIGLGLLALGQQPRSQGFQGLMGLMAAEDVANQRKADAAYREAQIADLQRKTQMAQQKQDMLAGIFGGASSPMSGVSTGGGVNVQQGHQQGRGLSGMTIDQVAALKAAGVDVGDLWKTAQQGLEQKAGSYYKMPDGSVAYLPALDKGMAVSGGQVVEAPGYGSTNAAIKAAEAGAVEAAKFPFAVGQDTARQRLAAQLDPVKVYNSQTGREEFMPRSNVAQQPQYSGAGYAGGSAAAAAPEQLQIMQAELNRLPPNHPDRPAIMREMQRLGGGQVAQSGNYAAGPSAAEAAANEARRVQAVEQVKADVSPTSTKIAAVDTARDALSVINQALSHPGLKTATGVQGTVDPRNYIPGTDATNFRVLMDQVKGGVFLDAYKDLKGGGAITEVEGAKAEAAKARINRAQSPDEFVKGLNEYKSIVERGLERASARASGQGGASGSWDEPKKPQQREFSMLPKASEYDGKRMRAPDGTIYRSSGGRWVKE